MSSFLAPPVLEHGDDHRWRLARQFTYRLGRHGWKLTVRKGFETDFASVPRPLWSIFPPAGPWANAAIIHDYLYREPVVSRAIADAIFLDAMAVLGVAWWRRWVMYLAVRLFGGRSFQGES